MPLRKLILLIVALLIGGGTYVYTRTTIAPPATATGGAEQAQVTSSVEVLVAARDLPSGTLVKEADLKWQPWPADGSTDSFAVKGKSETADYVGAVVRQGLKTGEPILTGRVVRKREQGFMAAVLNPGMRAVSVSITPVGGVAGFVFPGDRVDVIVAHQVNRKTDMEPNGHKVAETMMTNVRVLALDQKSDDQATEPKIAQTATLEVTPKQAETLALVSEIGTVSLALRSLANDAADAPPDATTAIAAAKPDGGMTWDSDVSHVLPGPNNRDGTVQRVQVMRGKDTTESVFDVRQ